MADLPSLTPAVRDDSVEALDKLLGQAKMARTRLEPVWLLNLSYYLGEQWVFYNRGRIDRPKLDPWRITLTDNRIIGVVRTELAKMTKQKPVWQVIPTTADDADLEAGRTGEKILDYLWRHLTMRNRLTDALLWSRITGAGFWKVTWDSAKGASVDVVIDGTGQPVEHAQYGGPIRAQDMGTLPDGLTSKRMAVGDVNVETISPFDLYPDPIAKQLEDAEWVIQESIKSPEYVFEHFGKRVTPDVDVAAGPVEGRMFPTSQTGNTSSYRAVRVREYWCKPNSAHPNGCRAVWAKGEFLMPPSDNPYGCLPYVMFKGVPVPGRFWPTCLVEQLRPVQTALNKSESQIAENAAKVGNPAMLISRQANTKVSGVPGEIIDYDDTTPNAIPSYLQAPALPQYVLEQQDRAEASIESISGQHEVSNAQVPAGVTAASAINLLLEADDTRLGPAIYDMEEVLGQAGEMLLKLVAQYWTDERTIMIAGQDHAFSVMQFKGAALRENTKVEVQAGSAFPQSKAARQAAIMQFLNLVLQNPQSLSLDPSQIKEMLIDMEAGGLEKAFSDMSKDEGQVNTENLRLSQGQMFNVNSFDEHPIHIKIHTDLMKSPPYILLDPLVQQNFEAHVAAHRMAMMAAMSPLGGQFQPPVNGGPPPIVPEQPMEPAPVAAEETGGGET